MEEARVKIRTVRTRLVFRDYVREMDRNNRLLAIGLYRIKEFWENKREEAKKGLETIKLGWEGLSDLRMDLRPVIEGGACAREG